MSPPDRKINLVTGWIVLGIAAAIGLYFGISKLVEPAPPPARTYVAYIDETASLREGDAVRIQGRRAGTVRAVELVVHDGKVVNRVEFEIAPGTGSPWLKDMERAGGIPRDSTISVRTPRMLGRPQLIIEIGDDDENPINPGGEWTHTKGANPSDQFSQWHEDIERTRDGIRNFNAILDDKEKFEQFQKLLGELVSGLEGADSAMSGLSGRGTDIDRSLTDAGARLEDLREQLSASRDSQTSGLEGASAGLAEAAETFSRIATDLARAEEQIARLRNETDGMGPSLQKARLDKAAMELRRMTASLRAGWALSVGDPSKAGDMPPWRRSRPYFHGSEPRVGTSIDETPPEAPAERAGLPKGVKIPKREK